VSVQYAGEVFPSTDVRSRYILMLGAGDDKDEVALSAKSHLLAALKKYRQQSDSVLRKYHGDAAVKREEVLPDFEPLLEFVLEKASFRLRSQKRVVVGEKALPYGPATCLEMVNFLRSCLLNSAGALPDPPDHLERPEQDAPLVSAYLASLAGRKTTLLPEYLDFLETVLNASNDSLVAKAYLQAAACGGAAGLLAGKLPWLEKLLGDSKEDLRDAVAQAVGLATAGLDPQAFEAYTSGAAANIKSKTLERRGGELLGLGYSFGRRILLQRLGEKDGNNRNAGGLENWEAYKSGVGLLLDALWQDEQPLLLAASCSALAEVGRCGPLPLPPGGQEGSREEGSKLSVVARLLALLKSAKCAMRIRERAALALGNLCVGDADFPHRRRVLEELLGCAREVRDVELHFSMGEAVFHAMAGPLSPVGRDHWRRAEADFQPAVAADFSDGHVGWALDQFCGPLARSTHPSERQASALWLLAVVKYGQGLAAVRARLADVQAAFMQYLGDGNDIVQDAASKGLGLVYDSCGDERERERMVGTLLGTLTGDRRQEVQKVSGETRIFEEGQLGKTPTGSNLTTYRELCSLATDLNQPDLVYKFMNLANHNALWNTRKGAAFGFSSIAAKAGAQMEQHLPKIVPKLYRYQFDPTPKIQESMSSIWSALVPETAKTLDRYLPEIVAELCRNLTNNQWRVRESCCMAVVDLMRGRDLEAALPDAPELFRSVFKVMDDIKESVRLAAGKAAEALSRTAIRMCDAAQSGASLSEKSTRAFLPVLLEDGLQTPVAEVRAVVVATVVKMAKSAGANLGPHLAGLVPALLEATGEMEGKEVSYLSVRMSNDPAVQERLDLARIAAARSSPTMECVNYALQFVDAAVLVELVPRLVELIKGHVGIGTKGAAAHVVTALAHQCPLDLQQYTGKILAAFVSGLSDHNAAVRKTYAAAIGQLMRTAKDSSLEKLYAKLRAWYMEQDGSPSQQKRFAVAYTYEAINRHNPDRIKAHAAQSLPLAFLAMHEEKVQKQHNLPHLHHKNLFTSPK
jgi:proteasome component ECM29